MHLLKQLKEQGYKVTHPREAVAWLLVNHPNDGHILPLTIRDIAKDLTRKQVKVDLVSIYRTLELFVKLGLVHEVEFGEGKKRYELASVSEHHHHLVCQHCGCVTDIDLPLEERIVAQVEEETHFAIKRHTMEFFGVCKFCRKKVE